jgi:glycerophosphoryl diester phosphodiesterase
MKLAFNPPVIGHRGACGYAPENTLVSFAKAKALGIQWVEFDVMLTKDHEVVVFHDDTLDRITGAQGTMLDHDYAFIKLLDAGSWFNPEFAGIKIPTLHEVILFLNQLDLRANIEIKTQSAFEKILVSKVLALIKEHWKKGKSAPLITSFSKNILEIVRHFSSDSMIGFLMEDWEEDWQEICDRLNCVTVDVSHDILDAQKANQIKSTGRLLLSYTVNETKRAQELFAIGVDAVFSDFPDRILK